MEAPPLLAPRVIAALDFGTTFSGFAFCPIADDSKIFQWCAPAAHLHARARARARAGPRPGQRGAGAPPGAPPPRARARARARMLLRVACRSRAAALTGSAACTASHRAPRCRACARHSLTQRVVRNRFDWENQLSGGGLPYSKTRTELLLARRGGGVLAWGWSALVQHFGGASGDAEYHKHFKLRLAPGAPPEARGARTARELIAKYLAQLGALATDAVRKQLGDHISAADIQWCITVPAIWGDDAKATMRRCMEDAGLVVRRAPSGDDAENEAPAGGSPHALLMVLEPEAASLYCQRKLDAELLAAVGVGGNIMVVDCGGGTTDIVVHRRVAQEGGEARARAGASGCARWRKGLATAAAARWWMRSFSSCCTRRRRCSASTRRSTRWRFACAREAHYMLHC
jgi:hypothetical protein